MAKVRKAVFPVGGLGTRFLPATKCMPKEMLPVVDKPVVQYAFEEARDSGIEQFIFVIGRHKNAINDHFDHAYELQRVLDEKGKEEELRQTVGWLPEPGAISFTRQINPLGLGHAIWCARHLVGDEPFAVLLPDDLVLSEKPCLAQMLEVFEKHPDSHIVATEDVPPEKTSSYGILDIESTDGNLVKARTLVEKPKPEVAPSNRAITGRYILQPNIFRFLENIAPGAGGELQLTDALRESLVETPLYGFLHEGRRYDCGNKAGFLEANIAYSLERPELRTRTLEIIKKYYESEFEGVA